MLFGFEAKTAWYFPATGPGSEVSAAKALPVGLPELVDHGVPAPDPSNPSIEFTILPKSMVAWLPRVKVPALGEVQRTDIPLFLTAYESPSIFFRPPPVS
jgi:hypothetical protein